MSSGAETLARERRSASFNPERLTELLHGGAAEVAARRAIVAELCADPLLGAGRLDDHFLSRADAFKMSLARMRRLFDDLERKKDLLDLLELAQDGEGVRIFIGSENKLFSLSGSSLVIAPYMDAERRIIGALGVIGPTRLNYGRVVPIVDYTARLMGRMVTDRRRG